VRTIAREGVKIRVRDLDELKQWYCDWERSGPSWIISFLFIHCTWNRRRLQ